MPQKHVVGPGEHLPQIAAHYGFRDWRTVWDAAENEELRARRGDAGVLHPGDELTIPDRETREASRATGKEHVFRARRANVMLRLRMLDPLGAPLEAAPCVLVTDGQRSELVTDGDGILEARVPSDLRAASLEIDGMTLDLEIGALDPVEETSGLEARLANLGYYAAFVGDRDEEELAFARRLFEHDEKKQPDGAAIAEVHGV
jgi:hypothetical protein